MMAVTVKSQKISKWTPKLKLSKGSASSEQQNLGLLWPQKIGITNVLQAVLCEKKQNFKSFWIKF